MTNKWTKRVRTFKNNRELLFLSLPGVLFIIGWMYIPLAYTVLLPFKEFDPSKGLFGSKWMGFKNFEFLFVSNDALTITRNTVLLNLLMTATGMVVSLLLAFLLKEIPKKSMKKYQTVIFFPNFLSWVVASYILLTLLDMDKGLINTLLKNFGMTPALWYNEPKYWLILFPLITIWKFGGVNALIYYTAIIGISPEYYESAELDGAGKFQQVWYITLPQIKSLITMLSLLAIGRIFSADFGLFYNMTLNSTALYPVSDVIDTYVYRALRVNGDVGMASAAGLYQSVVGFILVLVTNGLLKRYDPENAIY